MDCSLPGSSFYGISQEEYWSGLSFPSPGDFLSPGINPHLLQLLYWQVDTLLLSHLGSLIREKEESENLA